MLQPHQLRNLTNEELLNMVDRTNPETHELCVRLEGMIDQVGEACGDCVACNTVDINTACRVKTALV